MELINVAIDTEGVWMSVEFLGRSKIVYDNVRHINYNMPWHVADSHAEVTVIDSDIGLTIAENATLHAEDSVLFLEIMLYNCSGTYTLPTGEIRRRTSCLRMGGTRW